MSIYVFFPVAVFYYFNLPQFFEKMVADKRVCAMYIHVYSSLAIMLFLFLLFLVHLQKIIYPEGNVSHDQVM